MRAASRKAGLMGSMISAFEMYHPMGTAPPVGEQCAYRITGVPAPKAETTF
jgi:hypothetical protein